MEPLPPRPPRPPNALAPQSGLAPRAPQVSAHPPRNTVKGALPALDFPQEAVNASQHIAPGTSLYTLLGYAVVAVVTLVALFASAGFFLLPLAVGAIVSWIQARRVRAMIRGSGVQVSAAQMPELNDMVESFSRRLGLSSVPEVYIVEENVQNGFAVKLGKKNLVLLTDDVVWGALQSRDPRALGFVVGHELAHIALNHTGAVRRVLRTTFRPLARADEFSADNVAAQLVGEAQIAIHGLTLLTVGPQLMAYINQEALLQQVREVCADGLSKKAERNLSHPLLLRRIGNLMQ